MQNKQAGFSFVEIIIVLMLISVLFSFVIPTFFRRQKGVVKKQFVAEFTTLMQDALQQAIISHRIQQIYFDIEKHKILVKSHDTSIETETKHEQFSTPPDSITSSIQLPQQFEFRNFIIQGKDEVESGRRMDNAWFYIMPDGTSQAVIMNIEEQNPDAAENNRFSITVNPFYSQVEDHEKFQKI